MRYSNIVMSKNILVDKAGKNVLSYGNGAMLELMRNQAHLVNQADNYSFINYTENKISVGFTYSECLASNYIAFQNPIYGAKWFFAWIDSVTFRSDKMTEIEFTIDHWTTWYDMLNFKACYVLREHVANDTIGLNRVPEGLDIGEVECIESSADASLSDYSWIAIQTSWNPAKKTGYEGIAYYNGTVFGSLVCLVQNNIYGLEELFYFILQCGADGHASDIINIFVVPSAIVEQSTLELQEYTAEAGGQSFGTHRFWTAPFTDTVKTFTNNITKKYSWGDFTPKNNKLYCYPYNYLMVSNNHGQQNIYKYENFNDTNAVFQTELTFSIGGSGKLVPLHYDGQARDDDQSLVLGKYPTCGWSSDGYTNWLTQNAVDIPQESFRFGLDTVKNFASSAMTGIFSLADTILGKIGEFQKASMLPDSVNGSNAGDIIFAAKRNHFQFKCMRCRTQFLQVIDEYFSRFGYKIMRVKVPNMSHREHFNYVEIGQGERVAYGEVPPEALDTINKMFQSGVTIWHDHPSVGNFTISNNITQ